MSTLALVIIYNHQYNKNIEILEDIYGNRFSNIYHLVPFYNGEKDNVIPVYDSSFYFQGYVAQGFKSFFRETFDHYLFIADDLLLNPIISEDNYTEYLHLKQETCFIPGFINLHDTKEWWQRVGEAFRYSISVPGVEAKGQLPDYDIALQAFTKFGLEIGPLSFGQIWKTPVSIRDWGRIFIRNKDFNYIFRRIADTFRKEEYSLSYPLVGSYSDIFVVSSDAIKQFCHYCGVFSATKLFAEIALPTSLVLSAKDIVTEEGLKVRGKSMWTKEDYLVLEKYENRLRQLLEDFPEDYLYLHPIKLSKWNTET